MIGNFLVRLMQNLCRTWERIFSHETVLCLSLTYILKWEMRKRKTGASRVIELVTKKCEDAPMRGVIIVPLLLPTGFQS